MKSLRRPSIRNKLLLLLAVTLAPALAVISYTGYERRQEAMAEAHREALFLVDAMAAQQELLAESIATMLVTLSRLPMVQQQNAAASRDFFAELLEPLPHLNNIGLFTPDGELVASGRPVEPFNNAESRQFRRAVATGRLAAGEYTVNRIARVPCFYFALPVYDDDQRLTGVLQAGYKLEILSEIFVRADLPPQTVLGVLDHQGRMLYRVPPAEDNSLGLKAPERIWSLVSGPERQGAREEIDKDHRPRLFAYQQFFLPDADEPYMIFHVAVLRDETLMASRRALLRNLGLMGGAILAALLLTCLLSDRLLLAPLAKLVTATRRLKDGDLSARSALPHGPDELGQLTRAFDQMAATLEEKTRLLREAEEDYRTIFEQAMKGIFQSSEDGRFYRVNPAMAEIFGYASEDEMLRELNNLEQQLYVRNDDRRRLWSTLQKEGAVEDMELPMRRKDGSEIWVAISARLVREQRGRLLFAEGSLVNITARKAAEDEIRRSNAELEQFGYAVSHDMRQPLRMITGHLLRLEKKLGPRLADSESRSLHFAVDGAQRLDAMIVALLDYSRVGRKTAPKEMLAGRESLDEALAFLAPLIEERRAKIVISGSWPQIFASRDELYRLFQNLVDNAIKYHRPEQTPRVTITSRIKNGYWRVAVSDHGIGIDPGQMDRLFQVFSRLQSQAHFEGTGVGLALCRKIVTHHGGRIWVSSAGTGLGSRFVFELPLAEPNP